MTKHFTHVIFHPGKPFCSAFGSKERVEGDVYIPAPHGSSSHEIRTILDEVDFCPECKRLWKEYSE